ncbi:hypothetical protein ABT298_26390 [Streptomyces sp. NPDC001034]|uniref:hypothetical protein n=1 Tax=Streptomyces sp. NPDC001034 TaxID=3154375 RepID=UPI0033326E72
MTISSAWLSPDGQTRADTRVTQTGALTPVTESQGRSGVLPGSAGGQYLTGGLSLTGTTGTMTAQLGAGRAVIQCSPDRGAYPVTVTEPVPLTFADGDAQYGRIDLVVLRIYDHDYDGSGRTEAVAEIVPGTAAPTPVAPAAPDASLPLFAVTVAAGVGAAQGIDWNTALTDLRSTTVAVGGILPARSGDTAAGGYPGHYRDVDGTLQRWDGTSWIAYPKGTGGIAPAGKVTTGSYTGQYRESSAGVLQRWNGSAWTSAVVTSAYAGSVTSGSTNSTTYTSTLANTSGPLSLNFTAPPTGAVLLHFGARMWTANSTNSSAFMAPQISQNGTVTFAASDDFSCMYGGPVSASVATMWRLYGLTPGLVYTMTAMHRSNDAAVTCWFDTLFLRVDPAN